MRRLRTKLRALLPFLLTGAVFGMSFGVIVLVSGVFRWPLWVHAATLTSTNVEPADFHAGAVSTVTVSFTTTSIIPPAGKIKVTFPAGFAVAAASGGTCATMDGTFVTQVVGQTVMLLRQADGTPQAAGAQVCTIHAVVNPNISGPSATYTVATTTLGDVVLDDDSAVAADVFLPGVLGNPSITLSNSRTGATATATIIMTTVNPIEATGSIAVTFPPLFTVSGATGGTCVGMDGFFTTTIAAQVVLLDRSGGTAVPAGTYTCTISGIVNPTTAGPKGTYTLRTLNPVGRLHDTDTAVTGALIAATPLLLTNVEPASTVTGVFTPMTVTFTTINSIESDGVITVTFPAGFITGGVTNGGCSSMDGSFVASVNGLDVSLTRSGGTDEPAGAQTCTIFGVRTPAIPGTTLAYHIATKNALGAIHDADNLVPPDAFTRGPSVRSIPPMIPREPAVLRFGDLAPIFTPGQPYLVNWSSSGGVDSMRIDVWYSVDGGTTWQQAAAWTENDGSYIWDVPGEIASAITLRLVLSDLVTAAATIDSDAIAIAQSDTVSSDDQAIVPIPDPEEDVVPEEVIEPEPVEEVPDAVTEGPGVEIPWVREPVAFVQAPNGTTVYAIDALGTRHAFLDSLSFFTYQDNFSEVNMVATDVLRQYPLGAPMPPAPNSVLIKSRGSAEVFFIDIVQGEVVLRWIADESIAEAMFGDGWGNRIIDVPESMMLGLSRGADITEASDTLLDLSTWSSRTVLEQKSGNRF